MVVAWLHGDDEGAALLDFDGALWRVRDDFVHGNCEGLTQRPDGSPLTAIEKLELDVCRGWSPS